MTLDELCAARATVSSKMSLQIEHGFGGASDGSVSGGGGRATQGNSSQRGGRGGGVSGGEMPRRETGALMQLEEAAVAGVKEPVLIGGRI